MWIGEDPSHETDGRPPEELEGKGVRHGREPEVQHLPRPWLEGAHGSRGESLVAEDLEARDGRFVEQEVSRPPRRVGHPKLGPVCIDHLV